jgi:hypothetical protein
MLLCLRAHTPSVLAPAELPTLFLTQALPPQSSEAPSTLPPSAAAAAQEVREGGNAVVAAPAVAAHARAPLVLRPPQKAPPLRRRSRI